VTRCSGGWASDDGVGLRLRGQELVDVVAERPDAYAYQVDPDGDGGAVELRLTHRLLPGSA